MKIRKSQDRGHANHGWLDTHFTFSFADFYDPEYMGFADLRVINDDIIAPGKGFGTHPHKDMEIISYVLDGALEHRDSMGNGSVIRPGDVQRMSAGTGVTHSEFNPSQESPVHLLQIWILPNRSGHQPGYEQKHFPGEEKRGRLRLIASENGDSDSVSLNQDVRVFAGLLDGDEKVNYQLEDGRVAWIHVAQGEIEVNGEFLSAGDGASLDAGSSLHLVKGQKSEILIFDMAA